MGPFQASKPLEFWNILKVYFSFTGFISLHNINKVLQLYIYRQTKTKTNILTNIYIYIYMYTYT